MNYSRILILLLIVVMKVITVFGQGSSANGEAKVNSGGGVQRISVRNAPDPGYFNASVDSLYLVGTSLR